MLKPGFAICQWLLCSIGLLAHPPAYLACQSHNKHIGFSLRNLLDHLGDLFVFLSVVLQSPASTISVINMYDTYVVWFSSDLQNSNHSFTAWQLIGNEKRGRDRFFGGTRAHMHLWLAVHSKAMFEKRMKCNNWEMHEKIGTSVGFLTQTQREFRKLWREI